jgi:hypothetical protein
MTYSFNKKGMLIAVTINTPCRAHKTCGQVLMSVINLRRRKPIELCLRSTLRTLLRQSQSPNVGGPQWPPNASKFHLGTSLFFARILRIQKPENVSTQ